MGVVGGSFDVGLGPQLDRYFGDELVVVWLSVGELDIRTNGGFDEANRKKVAPNDSADVGVHRIPNAHFEGG